VADNEVASGRFDAHMRRLPLGGTVNPSGLHEVARCT
jgi:hypothetical protein